MFLIRYLDIFNNWQMIFCSSFEDLIIKLHSINLDLCELEVYSLSLLGDIPESSKL